MSKLEFRVDSREVRRYFTALSEHLKDTVVTTASSQSLDMGEAVNQLMALARATHLRRQRRQCRYRKPHGGGLFEER
jgi:hypothetical protein